MAKILYVSTSSTIGGAEKTLYTLASSKIKVEHEICGFVSVKPEGYYAVKLREQGIAVSSLNLQGLPNTETIRRLSEIISEKKPDIVHAFMYQAIQLARVAKLITEHDFKLISSPRVNYRTRSIWTRWIDGLLKNIDSLLISESEASRHYLVEKLGYRSSKVIVIHNGVKELQSQTPANRKKLRQEIGLHEEDILIGSIGRLDTQKNFSALIKAIGLNQNKNMHLAIIGNGPQLKILQALIDEKNLSQNVHLLGERSNAQEWLSCFDLFCLPSLWEGLPNAILEALSAGLPVIASNVDGNREIIVDHFNGLLVEPKDVNSLSKALILLSTDKTLQMKFIQNGHKTIEERFRLEEMITRYKDVYSSLTN